MDPTIAGLLNQYALAAFARHGVWQGELETAGRAGANAHQAAMQAITYAGFDSIVQGNSPGLGMAANLAREVPGSNLGPSPSGWVTNPQNNVAPAK